MIGDELTGPYHVILVVGEPWPDGKPPREECFVSIVDYPDLAAVRQFLEHAASSKSLFKWASRGGDTDG